MRADRAGERVGAGERAVGRIAELRDLLGDAFDGAAELAEISAEFRFDRRQIVVRLRDDRLQRHVGLTEPVEDRAHLALQPVVGAHEGGDGAVCTRVDCLAQGDARRVDRRSEVVPPHAELLDDRRATALDRVGDEFADVGKLLGDLATARRDEFGDERRLRIEEVLQLARSRDEEVVNFLAFLAERDIQREESVAQ